MALRWYFEVDWGRDGNYVDEGGLVTKIAVKSRGRDRSFGSSGPEPMKSGEVIATLENRDGRFDPYNTAGPLYGKILPGRPFRLRAEDNGVVRPVLLGRISDCRPQGASGLAVIKARDGLEFLGRQDCRAASAKTNYPVSSVIDDLLLMSDWPLMGDGELLPTTLPFDLGNSNIGNNGDLVTTWEIDTGRRILETIQDLAAAFLGTAFVNRSGELVYQPRNMLRSVQAEIDQSQVYGDLETTTPWDVIFNDVRVQPTTGAEQTAEDAASIAAFDRRSMQIRSNDFVQAADHAGYLADTLLAMLTGVNRNLRIKIEDRFELQFGLELMDLVAFRSPALGILGERYLIGQIEHDWQAGQGCVTGMRLEPDLYGLLGIATLPVTLPFELVW